MNREGVRDEILKMNNPNILCEIVTGYGKSKIALDLLNKRFPNTNMLKTKVLVVIWRKVLIANWKEEFVKWGYNKYLPYVEFVTYVSLPKKAGNWDFVIFDECHHLSDRCLDCLDSFSIKYSVLLSATVKRDHKMALHQTFKDLGVCKVKMREAIEEDILPDPKVYLIPMFLDNRASSFCIIRNKSKGNPVTINYVERFKWAKAKNRQIRIMCTQRQFYDDMSNLADWYKRRMMASGGPSRTVARSLYLHQCGERLKWLSDQKTSFVKVILEKLKDERTLTFCNGIAQTEELGTYCVNSKNKESEQNLQDFNNGRVAHITACNMLDEGEMTPQFF